MQPGNVLAVNPMVTAALQAAQWSVNNSYAATHLSTQPNAAAAAATSSSTATTHPQFVKVKPKWPLPFETNGGAYLFQAKSGCFFEPVSEFYYDVKAKLYYNSIDGTYYHYDATTTVTTSGEGSCHPFKLFIPPPPNDSYPDHTTSTAVVDTDTTADSFLKDKDALKTTNISSATTNISSTTATVGMSKVSIGFGMIGAKLKSKKIVTDIAKWGQIQQENRSEEEEDEAAAVAKKKKTTGNDKKSSSSATAATDKAGVSSSSSSSSSSSAGVKASESKRDRSGSDLAHISSTLASKPPRDHVAISRTTTTAADDAVNNHYSSSSSSSSSSRTVEQKSVVPAGANAPVCLVCKRQFASHDMLQRHERESKLHAENLLKLSQP